MIEVDLGLMVVFALYIAKVFLIDTKIRKQLSRKYTKNEYIKQVMFKPYILYIKEKGKIGPRLFWLNIGVVIWLLLSTILRLIHLYLIDIWIAKYMCSFNALLFLLWLLYLSYWSLRPSSWGEGLPDRVKWDRRNAYVTIIIIGISIVFLISIWVTNHFGN